jgi:hypothetical protein
MATKISTKTRNSRGLVVPHLESHSKRNQGRESSDDEPDDESTAANSHPKGSCCINDLNFCVHHLCLIGWVYVFYVGHVDRIDYMKPFSIL